MHLECDGVVVFQWGERQFAKPIEKRGVRRGGGETAVLRE